MAFPTTAIIDTFNRANEAPLATSSSGATWDAGSVFSGNTLAVVSNLAASNSGDGSQLLSTSIGPAGEVYVTLNTISNDVIQLYARFAGTGFSASGYLFEFNPFTGSYNVQRVDNAFVFTQLGASGSTTFTSGDVIGGSFIGSDLTSYKNGSVLITRTDSTYTAAGKIGLDLSDTALRVDNFGGGTFVPVDTGLAWIRA